MGPASMSGWLASSARGSSSRCKSSGIENCESFESSLVATSTVRLSLGSTRCTTARVRGTCQSEVSSRHMMSRFGGASCFSTSACTSSDCLTVAASAVSPSAAGAESKPGVSMSTRLAAWRHTRRTRISDESYAPRSASRSFSASTCARSSLAVHACSSPLSRVR